MQCNKCREPIILAGSKFCPKCGAKIEAPPKTPNIEKTFTGVNSISLNIGSRINVVPSTTPETKITIEASEEVKSKLKIDLSRGELVVDYPNSSVNNINISGRGISIGGVSIRNTVMVGRGNRISVNNLNISTEDDGEVIINISTPAGVDLDVNVSGGLDLTVGDLKNKVSLDTSGGCNFRAQDITDFDADTSGGLTATIEHFSGGICNLDTSGSCVLTVPSGNIEKLIVDASGNTVLNVNAQTAKAVIDTSGIVSGTLRADIVRKDISGRDSLTIVR